jgi:hypothetical protein
MITLDKNYRVEVDSFNFTLVQEEQTDKVSEGSGKKIVTHNTWHYPKLNMALKKYLQETLKPCSDIETVLKRIDEVEKIIDKLK